MKFGLIKLESHGLPEGEMCTIYWSSRGMACGRRMAPPCALAELSASALQEPW